MRKYLIKTGFGVLVVLLLIRLFIYPILEVRKSDQQIRKDFTAVGLDPAIQYYKNGSRSLRYIMSNKLRDDLPNVVFVHGAPGSSGDFIKYMKDSTLIKQANLIAVDRLGYGYSGFGNAVTSIEDQARIINDLIHSLSLKNVLVVGWSFGGPIAVKMAVEESDIHSLLLLAPAIDPNNEKHFIFGYLAKWNLTKWVVPKAFRVAEKEKLSHVEELKKLQIDWKRLSIPVVHIHGTKDWMVPIDNLYFSKKVLTKGNLKPIIVDNGTHFLPWKNYSLVKEEIIKLINL